MNFKTRLDLWRAKKDLSPDRAFRSSLWKQLDVALNVKYPTVIWFHTIWFKRAVAFAMVIIIIMGGTGAYAYTNDEVIEGTAFYPIKTAIEKVEEKIKINPEAKARFYLKQLKRRDNEKKIMLRKGSKIEKIERSIERTEDQLEKTDKVIEKINSKDVKLREEVKARLKVRFEKRKEKLGEKIERLKDRADELKIN